MAHSESSAGGLEMVSDPSGRQEGGKAGMLRLGPSPFAAEETHDPGYETDGTAFSDAGYTTEGNTPTSEAQGLLQGALSCRTQAHAQASEHSLAGLHLTCTALQCACVKCIQSRSTQLWPEPYSSHNMLGSHTTSPSASEVMQQDSRHDTHCAEMEAGESPVRVLPQQPRPPGSILKGLAPRALLASPDASPRASDGHETTQWNSLAEVCSEPALQCVALQCSVGLHLLPEAWQQ